MSIWVRIDYSVSFSIRFFRKGICVKNPIRKTTTKLRDLIHFVGFLMGMMAFTVLGVEEASLHHLTVEFKVFRGLGFFKVLRGLGLRV